MTKFNHIGREGKRKGYVMQVEDIFSSKQKSKVLYWLQPEATVSDAIRLMAEHKVSCVIVSRDGKKVRGMVTFREIIQSIAEMGMVCLIEPIELIMSTEVATCRLQDPVGLALSKMVKAGRKHIPIIERGNLVGVLTMGDTARARVAYLESCLADTNYEDPDVDTMYGVRRPGQQVHVT